LGISKVRKRNNLCVLEPKYDSAGFARRIIFGFYLICDPKLQPIEALKGTDKFLEVPLRGTSKNLSRFYKSAKRCTAQKS